MWFFYLFNRWCGCVRVCVLVCAQYTLLIVPFEFSQPLNWTIAVSAFDFSAIGFSATQRTKKKHTRNEESKINEKKKNEFRRETRIDEYIFDWTFAKMQPHKNIAENFVCNGNAIRRIVHTYKHMSERENQRCWNKPTPNKLFCKRFRFNNILICTFCLCCFFFYLSNLLSWFVCMHIFPRTIAFTVCFIFDSTLSFLLIPF